MHTLTQSRQIDSAQLPYIFRRLEQAYGLAYDSPDSGLVAEAIADRMEAIGVADVGSYAHLLEDEGGAAELRELVDRATVRETRFFRERGLYAVLADEIVPSILDRCWLVGRPGKPLMVWSAGCSTGDEAYSIAIVLLEMARKGYPLSAKVVGTDVSPTALAQASSGIYPESVVSRIESELLERYFTRVSPSEDQEPGHVPGHVHEGRLAKYKVASELAACVRFLEHNLAAFPYPQHLDGFDLIVCRKVLMYFTQETASRVVYELGSRLNEGGYLILDPWVSCPRLAGSGLEQVQCPYAVILRKTAEQERASGIDRGCSLPEQRRPEPCSPQSHLDERDPARRHQADRCTPETSAQGDVEAMINQARKCAGCGDWAHALSLLATVEQMAPLDPRVYRLKGEIHLQRSELDAACSCFARLIYLQPKSAVAYWRMADIYRQMRRYTDEMRQLHNVLQCLEDSGVGAAGAGSGIGGSGADSGVDIASADPGMDAACEVPEDALMKACLNRIEELRRRLRESHRASGRS